MCFPSFSRLLFPFLLLCLFFFLFSVSSTHPTRPHRLSFGSSKGHGRPRKPPRLSGRVQGHNQATLLSERRQAGESSHHKAEELHASPRMLPGGCSCKYPTSWFLDLHWVRFLLFRIHNMLVLFACTVDNNYFVLNFQIHAPA